MGAKRHEELGGLTVKEERFVSLYVFGKLGVGGNATECYKRSFDTQATHESMNVLACRLLKKPYVSKRLSELLEGLTNKKAVMRGIMAETTTEHSRDRTKAWELLGKTHAMFVDKKEVDVKIHELMLEDEDFSAENAEKVEESDE